MYVIYLTLKFFNDLRLDLMMLRRNNCLSFIGGGAFKYKDEITKKLGVRYDCRNSFIN